MPVDHRHSVVFIDLDHTLLDGPFDSLVFPQVLGELSRKTGLDYDNLLALVRSENRARQTDPTCPAVLAMDWDDIFTRVADRLGVTLETRACDVIRAHPGPPYAVLLPGAVQALERLTAGRPRRAVVLATKGLGRYQLPVLRATGLLHYFDDVLTPEITQALKYSPEFYGSWPARTRIQIMVGDTYEDDVLPAHRFGFKTVLKMDQPPGSTENGDPFIRAQEIFSGAEQTVRPDAVIYALDELPEVIEKMENEVQDEDL
jgi:putative hydrolase of the HAD superfamily